MQYLKSLLYSPIKCNNCSQPISSSVTEVKCPCTLVSYCSKECFFEDYDSHKHLCSLYTGPNLTTLEDTCKNTLYEFSIVTLAIYKVSKYIPSTTIPLLIKIRDNDKDFYCIGVVTPVTSNFSEDLQRRYLDTANTNNSSLIAIINLIERSYIQYDIKPFLNTFPDYLADIFEFSEDTYQKLTKGTHRLYINRNDWSFKQKVFPLVYKPEMYMATGLETVEAGEDN